MYLVLIAWAYIVVMMAIAEASSPVGTLLGAVVTLVLYGLLPMAIVAYVMGTPGRKRRLAARRADEQAAYDAVQAGAASDEPDGGGHAPTAAQTGVVAPVREEP